MVNGQLVEYIPSVSLRDFDFVSTWTTRVPPLHIDLLKRICDKAVTFVDRVSDFDILNLDVRLDNCYLTSERQNSVVLIDLTLCRLRLSDETNEVCRGAKQSEDESGRYC